MNITIEITPEIEEWLEFDMPLGRVTSVVEASVLKAYKKAKKKNKPKLPEKIVSFGNEIKQSHIITKINEIIDYLEARD